MTSTLLSCFLHRSIGPGAEPRAHSAAGNRLSKLTGPPSWVCTCVCVCPRNNVNQISVISPVEAQTRRELVIHAVLLFTVAPILQSPHHSAFSWALPVPMESNLGLVVMHSTDFLHPPLSCQSFPPREAILSWSNGCYSKVSTQEKEAEKRVKLGKISEMFGSWGNWRDDDDHDDCKCSILPYH